MWAQCHKTECASSAQGKEGTEETTEFDVIIQLLLYLYIVTSFFMCIYTIVIEILKFLQIIVASRLPDTKLPRTISLVWFYHTYPRLLVIILHLQLLQVVVALKQPDSWWSQTIWLVWFHHTYHRLLVIILHKIVVAPKLSGTQLSWTISLV